LPRTRKWQEVIDLIATRADTAEIAAATLDASKRGLEQAASDPALVQSFWLLSQLPLCARKPSYISELADRGVPVTNEPTLMELVGGFSDAVDQHVYRTGGRTDVGEMAQMGAAKTIASVLGERTASLFEVTAADVRRELARLGTPRKFSSLARSFFARVAERYLTYFLSRELSNQLASTKLNKEFREALSLHCEQASKILEKFAADWFSKHNYRGGITPRKAAKFVEHALNKLSSELQQGTGREAS
jgi:hypothetical protein